MIFRIVMNDKTCVFKKEKSLSDIKDLLESDCFLEVTHCKTGNKELINVDNIKVVRISSYETIEEAVEDTLKKTGC